MEDYTLVIFGITSNLAQIKLIPALYDMEEKGSMPKDMKIIGIARKEMQKSDFHKYLEEVLHLKNIHHTHEIKPETFQKLCNRFDYVSGEIQDPKLYQKLKAQLQTNHRIYYLATYPDLYKYVFENLQQNKLNSHTKGWVRLMIEKPIGNDLKFAKALNNLLLKYFTEDQIFRLDHYLGKETIQNILTFRFANDVYEPLINKDYIDHIQITATEDFGIGKRGGYYDVVGALKDVGQNHQLQMLAFATMEKPTAFTNEAVTKERIKILKVLKPLPEKVVFGQYEGYTKEEKVDPDSNTDTFYALKAYINNERFKNVPIYIRAGKKLKQTVTEISIVFKKAAFGNDPNVLIYRITPNEGIVLKILVKKPGYKIELEPEYMQYCYRIDPHSHYIPDPYEKLLVDTIRGDQTFFNHAEEVEAQWAFTDPLSAMRKKPHTYKVGSWGPKEADELIEADGRKMADAFNAILQNMKSIGYTLWLVPTGDAYTKFSNLINKLAKEYNAPVFVPHITLLGEFTESEEDAIAGAKKLVEGQKPFTIKMNEIGFQDYFGGLYLCTLKNLLNCNLFMTRAKKIFNFDVPPYMPHMSLLYGMFPQDIKDKIIREIGKDQSAEFKIEKVTLHKGGEIKDWKIIKEFPLK